MVSPQWVLTAGHCFRSSPNNPPTRAYTSAIVYLGTATTNGQASSDVFIHPNWWHPGETPAIQPTATWWNSSYDVALIRLPSPQPSSSQYPGHYYNQLSNSYMNAGEWLTCAGYGATSVPQNGGGIGVLRNAELPINSVGQFARGVYIWSSHEMIQVGPNNGQIIYEGDSGGSCYQSWPYYDPWVISGTTAFVVYPGMNQAPTEGWLVYPWYVEDWVDATMHGSPISIPTTGAPAGAIYTEASGTSQWGDGQFVFAADPSGTVSVSGRYDNGPFSAFSALPITYMENMPGPSSGVGIATTNLGYVLDLSFYLARVGGDGQIYTAELTPSGHTAPPWGFFSYWNPAGWPAGTWFVSNTPAVAFFPPNRQDYFALGADGQIWTRTRVNYSWQGDWSAIAGGVGFQGPPSVAMAWGSQYYVAALDGYGSPWMAAMYSVDGSGGGGPWSGWFQLGGNFLAGIAVTGWDRGMDFYGIGLDNALWHYSVDNDFQGSDWWFSLGGYYTEPASSGVTASTYQRDQRRIDISVLDAGGQPQLIHYPW